MRPWLALVLLTWPSLATGDVVMPGFKLCPLGHTLEHSHGGSFCRPPLPRDCKPGQIPTALRDRAYCDEPPARPCPTGSHWRSPYLKDKTCVAGALCRAPDSGAGDAADRYGLGESATRCGEGEACKPSALCTKVVFLGRMSYLAVSGTCRTDADCPGRRPPNKPPPKEPYERLRYEQCVKAWRCDPEHKRGPDDRTDPAKYLEGDDRSVLRNPDLLITPVVTIGGGCTCWGCW